jgi:hypothetical protein
MLWESNSTIGITPNPKYLGTYIEEENLKMND